MASREEPWLWKTPRPLYMRELEPLAHDGAWPSPTPICNGTPEQIENRTLFRAGLSRKRSVSSHSTDAERKTG